LFNAMLKSCVVRIVDLSAAHPWWVIAVAVTLAAGSAVYVWKHFAIRTDVNELISTDLPWRQRQLQFERAFPQRDILVVVDAPTPELAEQAAAELAQALVERHQLIRSVRQVRGGPFFEKNGLLFLPLADLRRATSELTRGTDLIETLATDQNLRGMLDALSLALAGVERGELKLDDLTHAMTMSADTVDAVLAGKPANFSWSLLASGKPASRSELRRLIEVDPVLDFSALEPGRAATNAIAATAATLDLERKYQARVRQTGRIPTDDDEFGSIKENLSLNAAVSLTALFVILWLALRSLRIIAAVAVSLAIGLLVSAAWGLHLVVAFNWISLAFFALFVGLGVDFGIQFGVRYRAERHALGDLREALHQAASKAGEPLALAAAATAVGFASFLPTAYRGLSELGEIAGCGMIIAFVCSITVLPALLSLLRPPGEPRPMGWRFLAPADRFLERRRIPVVVITVVVVAALSPLLVFLPFDFNPLHLQSPKVESVATLLELRKDPLTATNAIDVMAPDLAAADAIAKRLAALPEVSQTRTLTSLVPEDQDEKLALIRDAAPAIEAALAAKEADQAPSDADNVEALASTADYLSKIAGDKEGPPAQSARRLAGSLARLAQAQPPARAGVEAAFVAPLRYALHRFAEELHPERVTAENIPPDVARDWIAPDGRARAQALPKGDPDDTEVLRKFARAVLAAEPNATGFTVLLYEARGTVLTAFVQAGIFALLAIALLLWIALRRLGDVLLTLVPLVIAGLVTLELCALIELPLNFADILALPLLLGVGVAFKIYYIMAWRTGRTGLLQSSLTRAVIFSAMTSATAFGSLWLSSQPGMSSMGKLMALALVCTMAAAVLFQPALMGPPRARSPHEAKRNAG
jgi:uncharacterized protein